MNLKGVDKIHVQRCTLFTHDIGRYGLIIQYSCLEYTSPKAMTECTTWSLH